MIKAFLFDYGGVVSAGGGRDTLPDHLAKNLGISAEAALALLKPVWADFSRGKLSEDEVWSTMERQYGKSITTTQRSIWNTWEVMQPQQVMVEAIHDLKARGLIVGLLSNTVHVTADDIRAHGGYEAFEPLVLSCEVGFAKPQPEIYEYALRQLPSIKPDEVVFLDDQEHCLVPARAIGMKTILVTDAAQAITAIHAYL